ncbi:non-ribosomal peptide synthetase, partial [Pseudomonas syringae]
NADGTLDYLGRNDDQVKIRGLRVELGEIEARLAEHADVREAVVLCRQDVPGDKRLVAYVTTQQPETVLDIEHLRSHLQGTLPDYMVPTAYVQLDALPLTANGKLDRKALPMPDAQSLISRGYEAPQGEVEIQLASIWADVLTVEQVGRHDHFFELGGHSLLAVKLIERMRQVGLSADVRVLFSQPTLAALATAVGGGTEVVVPANLIPERCEHITPDLLPLISLTQAQIDCVVKHVPGGATNVQDIYPLAPLQAGILYHHISAEQGDPYTLKALFSLRDRARLDDFSHALQAVIDRHDILRTAVLWEGLDEPVQVVLRQAEMHVTELCLDPVNGPIDEQLHERFDPRHYRLDVRQAPLMQIVFTHDPLNDRWLAMLLFHHLVNDATSLYVVLHEMQAHLLGQGASLGQSVPYRNYVAQARLGVSDAQHEAFFREMLGDIDEPTLPFGLQDVQEGGGDIEEASVILPAELNLRLRAQARQAGVSAASLMHLAWARVLGSVSAREQVVFGTVLLGRMQAGEGADHSLGMFINTLPLRVDIGATTVVEGLKATHGQLTALLGHEHAPLVLAQRCSGVDAPAPLFSALLNYRHSVVSDVSAETATAWEGIESFGAKDHTNYPLTLNIDDVGNGFNLTVLVSSTIGAKRVCGYMQTVLEHLSNALEQSPSSTLDSLPFLPAAEREQLLVTFNDSARDYPQQQTVHSLFEAQVRACPEACAAIHDGVAVSYAELNTRANRLARHLLGLGVQQGDSVAILLERSHDLLASQLAVLKCAAVYVPLDINAPVERQAFMVEDSQARVLLTHSQVSLETAAQRVDLDGLPLNDLKDTDLALPQSSESVAYIMYTSGSTGVPKGVLVPHRAISRLVINNGYADFNAQDRVAFASNPAFDASTLDVWAPLLNGGCVVVIGQNDLLSPRDFQRLLLEQSVTVLWMTAGLFHQYASGLGESFSRLRYLIVGGDVLDPAVIGRVLANSPPQHLLNGYGPTEATTFSATYEITSVGNGSIPIGKPVGNSRLYVLGSQGQPVPLGVPGELYIGGQGVARGYLNRDELTLEKFVADPFDSDPQARLYRTGDLVRWRADGNLEYLGRNDDQVKIRGFRVELGEIEARLAEHSDIREAVVLCRQDEPGDKRLVAYVTAQQPETALDIERLRNHLQGLLPDYMVPAAYVQLDALPLTTNGKLDRKALPVPDAQALISRGYEAPQGEVEAMLAEIWAEVLQVEQVGRYDNFFDLGGHSLLAMRMVSQVRQQLGVELPLGELFALGELAAVAAALNGVARSELTAILPVKRDQPMPLSFAQQRLWFLAQMDGGNEAYNIPMALSLVGALDVTALARALARIVERHETLRSRFVTCEGAAQVLFVPTCADAGLSVEDIRHAPHGLEEFIRVEAVAPFDLANGPLIRAHLLQVADDRHVLLMTVHHIVADGWSMAVLSQELLKLYPAFCQGQPDPLPALAIQYADYAVWQRRWLSGERLQHQAAYWHQALEGAPTLLTLPTDRPRPAQQDFAGASLAVQLNANLAADLRKLAQRQGVTLYMALMAAWATTLTRLSGQADVVIGSPVAGRGHTELEDLIGLFVNTLAVRIDTSGNPSGEALLARVKARVLEAQEHQDLPFEQVVEVVRPTRSLAHPPLFQTTLNWMPGKNVADSLGDLRVEPVEQNSQVSKFDLSLNLSEQGETLAGTLDYATALFDETTAQRYLDYFMQILEALAADEQTHLDRIPLVGEEERRYLLETLNTTALAQVNDEQTVHAMIEARAASAPEGVAAQVGEHCLHYGEMNHRANALAHHLISLGVGVDDRVAVMARRGLDTLVAMLAVLKAGAGYVPVDPSHPDERIAYLLA